MTSPTERFSGELLFTVFHIFGMWQPTTGTCHKWNISFYNIYTFFNLTIHFTFTFSLFIYLWQVTENADDFTHTLFYFSCVFAVFIKIVSFVVKNKNVIELHEMFSDKRCQPRDAFELKIIQDVSQTSRINTIIFQIMITIPTSLLFILSFERKSLILNAWFPFNINNSKFVFMSLYLYQTFALWMTAMLTAAIECFAMLMILQIGGQLDIVIHRLNLLSDIKQSKNNYPEFIMHQLESSIIKDCVIHHNYIYALGHKLNQLFGFVIFVQFFSSVAAIFAIIHQVSRINLNNHSSWLFLVYLSTTMFQIFLYSYYGEKLIERSQAISPEIWPSNWISLSNKTKKDLNFIMIRATRPIKMTGLSVIEMSLTTFVKVIKSAYSMYNLTNAF